MPTPCIHLMLSAYDGVVPTVFKRPITKQRVSFFMILADSCHRQAPSNCP